MKAPDTFQLADLLKWLAVAKRDRPILKASFRLLPEGKYLRLQHDVDLSLIAAAQLAEAEHAAGFAATYNVMVGADFYDVCQQSNLLDRIASLGHDIGLHFDPRRYQARGMKLENGLVRDVAVLKALGHPPAGVCLHKPLKQGLDWAAFRDAANGAGVQFYERKGETYVSDSAGGFRDAGVETLRTLDRDWLRLNLHPEWWLGLDRVATVHGILSAVVDRANRAVSDWETMPNHPNAKQQDKRDENSGDPARRARVEHHKARVRKAA